MLPINSTLFCYMLLWLFYNICKTNDIGCSWTDISIAASEYIFVIILTTLSRSTSPQWLFVSSDKNSRKYNFMMINIAASSFLVEICFCLMFSLVIYFKFQLTFSIHAVISLEEMANIKIGDHKATTVFSTEIHTAIVSTVEKYQFISRFLHKFPRCSYQDFKISTEKSKLSKKYRAYLYRHPNAAAKCKYILYSI